MSALLGLVGLDILQLWRRTGNRVVFGTAPECPVRVESGGSGQATPLPLLWVGKRRSN